MTIDLGRPGPAELDEVVAALGSWQDDDAAFQLHPGHVGWLQRQGAETTAAALTTWRQDATIVAVAQQDGPVARLGITPELQQDLALATRLAEDLARVESLEAPPGALVREVLSDVGWRPDESWTPLARLLTDPVEEPGVRVRLVTAPLVEERVAVHRASFTGSRFTADAWNSMAAGPAYARARCVLIYDDQGAAVAAATVWSAGPGRPGLLEPLGVAEAHRGRGFGRAISLAAAATLRDLGSSSATVCTPTANVGGVATYESAGFVSWGLRKDLRPPQ